VKIGILLNQNVIIDKINYCMKKLAFTFFIILCLGFGSNQSSAATYTWIGANNAEFAISTNFSPARTYPYSKMDTILIVSGFGGDTIVSTSDYQPGNHTSYFFQVGMVHVVGNRVVTFYAKARNFIYTQSLIAFGVNGQALKVDQNATLNIYTNKDNWLSSDWTNINFGNVGSSVNVDVVIDGKLTFNTISNIHRTNAGSNYISFNNATVYVNGVIEFFSDPNVLNTRNDRILFGQKSKMILTGDLIFKGGRQSINFADSSLQVEPTGRVIIDFLSDAHMHNIKGIYKTGSQLIVNNHPGSDTALITLPDSIHHLIVNSSVNARPITFIAKSNLKDSLVPIRIKGNVQINNSGSSAVEFNFSGVSQTATIEGNLELNGGSLQIRNFNNSDSATASRLYVKGNYLQQAGNLNFVGENPKVGQLLVAGNFFQYGGFIRNTSGSLFPQIVFNGNAPQTLRLSSQVDDSITFVFNNPAGFVLDSNLIIGTGSAVNFISGTFSGLGNIIYSSPTSTLMSSNSSPAAASNYLWSNTLIPSQVKFNNTALLSIPGTRRIARKLIVANGILSIPASDSIIIGSSSVAGQIEHIGSGRVLGKITAWVGRQAGTYVFPLGTSNQSKPISIQYITAPNAAGTLSASYIATAPSNSGLPIIQANDSIFRTLGDGFWRINSANNLAGGTYTARAFSTTISGLNNFSSARLLKRNTSLLPWLAPGTLIPSVGKNDSFYVARTGLSGFSDFALAESAFSLSIPTISNNTIGSNQSFCHGNTASPLLGSLPNVSSGPFSYLWIQSLVSAVGPFLPANGTNNAQNYSPGVLAQKTWFKRLVIAGLTTDTSAEVLIDVLPKLALGFSINKQIQCINGNEFIFTDTTQLNTGRLWKYGNGDTSTAQILVLSFTSGPVNSYSIKLLGSFNGNCPDSITQIVYTTNPPKTGAISGAPKAALLSTETYQVPNRGGSTYQWFFSKGTGVSFTNSIQIKWRELGNDQIKVVETANNSCVGDTVFFDVSIEKLIGISSNDEERNLSIFPNPNAGVFRIQINNSEIDEIKIFDMYGNLVDSKVNHLVNSSEEYNFTELAEGVYFIHILKANTILTVKKMIIQKD